MHYLFPESLTALTDHNNKKLDETGLIIVIIN